MNLLKSITALWKSNNFIVITGNPLEGYEFIGPFTNLDDAMELRTEITESGGEGYVTELSKEYCNE